MNEKNVEYQTLNTNVEVFLQNTRMPGSSPIPNEHSWSEKIRRGDMGAFKEMFNAYYSGVFRFIWHYVKSAETAEELVQELFTRIWEKREEWKPHGSPRSYIYKMAKHLAIDHFRHRRVVQEWQEEASVLIQRSERSLAEDIEMKLLLEDLERAVKTLPDRCRLVFILSRYDGMSYSEIADTLGISTNTVETQIARALKVIRKHLSSYIGAVAFLSLMKDTLR